MNKKDFGEYGIEAINFVDIDKAIRIIRNTEKEEDVVPNLAAGFNLTTRQAEYIAEIKLRNLNREYIINRTEEIGDLEKEIEDLKTDKGDGWNHNDICNNVIIDKKPLLEDMEDYNIDSGVNKIRISYSKYLG